MAKKQKSKVGRPIKHGAYSLILKEGELPENRRYIREYLIETRKGIILDLGGEESLTTAKVVLVDRAISLLSICRVIEEWVRENGVFTGRRLQPVLSIYLSFLNQLRSTLLCLGLERAKTEEILTPLELAKEIDEEKAKAKEEQLEQF